MQEETFTLFESILWTLITTLIILFIIIFSYAFAYSESNHLSPSDLACQKLGYEYETQEFIDHYCVKDNKLYPVVLECDLSMEPDRCKVYEIQNG